VAVAISEAALATSLVEAEIAPMVSFNCPIARVEVVTGSA